MEKSSGPCDKRNAGNSIVGEDAIRSIGAALYNLGAEEVLVVGHTECGMAGADVEALKEKMLARGIKEEDIAKYVLSMAAQYENTDGNIAVFSDLSEDACRELINMLVKKCSGIAAVFFRSGSGGYRYIMGSRTRDLRAESKTINAAICGKGGGKPEMIMGSCMADKSVIESFFYGN